MDLETKKLKQLFKYKNNKNFSLMSVMQINMSDSEISGTGQHQQHGFQSKQSADLESLMGNLTMEKPAHGVASQKSVVPDGHASVGKKTDFFGKK